MAGSFRLPADIERMQTGSLSSSTSLPQEYEKYAETAGPYNRKNWLALAPAVLALVSLALIILSIFAGYSPGVMEDYHVIYFNTSTLGKSLLDDKGLRARSAPMLPMITQAPVVVNHFHANHERAPIDVGGALGGIADGVTSAAADATSVGGQAVAAASSVATEAASAVQSAAQAAQSGLEHLVDEAKDALEEISDDLADELYKKLGIQQFYSLHLTDMCFGNFTPNATATGAGFGVVNCTQPLNWTQALDLTGMLNQSLGVGPFQLDLGDIGMVQDVVEAIDGVMKILNSCLEAILAMYIIAAFFTGLAIAIAIWAIFELSKNKGNYFRVRQSFDNKRVVHVASFGATWAATLFLLIGNLVTTLGGKYGVEKVREHGESFGLYAYRGSKFLAVTWSALGLVLMAAIFWTWMCLVMAGERYKRSKREGFPKPFFWESPTRKANGNI